MYISPTIGKDRKGFFYDDGSGGMVAHADFDKFMELVKAKVREGLKVKAEKKARKR